MVALRLKALKVGAIELLYLRSVQKDQAAEEPDEVKVSRPVLQTSRSGD